MANRIVNFSNVDDLYQLNFRTQKYAEANFKHNNNSKTEHWLPDSHSSGIF